MFTLLPTTKWETQFEILHVDAFVAYNEKYVSVAIKFTIFSHRQHTEESVPSYENKFFTDVENGWRVMVEERWKVKCKKDLASLSAGWLVFLPLD